MNRSGRTPIKGRIQPDRVRCANAFMQLVSIREGDRQAGRVDAQRLGHPHPGWSAGTRAREGRHHRGRRDVRACGWRSDRRKATQPLPIRVLVGDACGDHGDARARRPPQTQRHSQTLAHQHGRGCCYSPWRASPQRHRRRVKFFGGNRAVIDGPFADSNRSLLSHRTKAAQKPYT
jgi:hypothetical protein